MGGGSESGRSMLVARHDNDDDDDFCGKVGDRSRGPTNIVHRLFTNGPGDRSSIPGQVIPKTQKIVFDTSLLNTQYHKVRTKGKMEQSREMCTALPYTSVL